MRTLVVSDLHLGGRTGVDVLRDPVAREPLLAELARTSRLVLLGDTLELRHGPAREALARARPALEAIGAALPAGAEVVLVPGNHDHALAAPWLDARAQRPLGHETRVKPGTASALARQVAGWLGGGAGRNVGVEIAYPGVWLRADVYAMHGHYLDPHGTVPTFERLAAGAMSRMVGAVPGARRDRRGLRARARAAVRVDHERRPARRPRRAWAPARGAAGKAYELLQGDGHQPVRARLLTAVFPLGIRGAEPARDRARALRPLRRRAAPQRARRARRGRRPPRHRGRARHLRPQPPRRPAARRRRHRVAHADRRLAAQQRQLGPRAGLHPGRRHRQPLLARRRDPRRGHRRAAAPAAAGRRRPRAAPTRLKRRRRAPGPA